MLDNLASVIGNNVFRCRLAITNPTLRSFMGLDEHQEAHYDVQAALTQDPVTCKQVVVVSQVDVTEIVIAKRQVQQANDLLVKQAAQLLEEKRRSDALLQRQVTSCALVDC